MCQEKEKDLPSTAATNHAGGPAPRSKTSTAATEEGRPCTAYLLNLELLSHLVPGGSVEAAVGGNPKPHKSALRHTAVNAVAATRNTLGHLSRSQAGAAAHVAACRGNANRGGGEKWKR